MANHFISRVFEGVKGSPFIPHFRRNVYKFTKIGSLLLIFIGHWLFAVFQPLAIF